MSAPVYPATGRTLTVVRASAVMVTNRPFSKRHAEHGGGGALFRRNSSPWYGDFRLRSASFVLPSGFILGNEDGIVNFETWEKNSFLAGRRVAGHAVRRWPVVDPANPA